MPKVLFACYHPLERGTVIPWPDGYALWATRQGFWDYGGMMEIFPSRRGSPSGGRGRLLLRQRPTCHHSGPHSPGATGFCPIPRRLTACARVICSLHPELSGIFPLRVQEWVPYWRRFVDETLHSWRPEVVVLSVGQISRPRLFAEPVQRPAFPVCI